MDSGPRSCLSSKKYYYCISHPQIVFQCTNSNHACQPLENRKENLWFSTPSILIVCNIGNRIFKNILDFTISVSLSKTFESREVYFYFLFQILKLHTLEKKFFTSCLQMVYFTMTLMKKLLELSVEIVVSECQLCGLRESFNIVLIRLLRVSMRRLGQSECINFFLFEKAVNFLFFRS